MADPNRPEDDAADDARRPAAVAADESAATTPYEPARTDDEARTERLPADRDDDVRTERLAADRDDARTEVVEPAAATAVHPHAEAPAAPPAQRPLPTTEEGAAPPPPRTKGNRRVATAGVLLAAGLFQVLFFGVNALVVLVFGGTAEAVVQQVQAIAGTPLAWLPVLLFFLLFELTVLLINRAGRVAYVLASLIVGAIVYVLTALLFSAIVRHTLGDANTLAQTFLNWEFILVGLVAREVMLWTGLAIGSRGIRVRRRYREARRSYEQEVGDVRG